MSLQKKMMSHPKILFKDLRKFMPCIWINACCAGKGAVLLPFKMKEFWLKWLYIGTLKMNEKKTHGLTFCFNIFSIISILTSPEGCWLSLKNLKSLWYIKWPATYILHLKRQVGNCRFRHLTAIYWCFCWWFSTQEFKEQHLPNIDVETASPSLWELLSLHSRYIDICKPT